MKRSELRIIKKRIRNLIVLGILLLGLITAYKIYPTSKSEKIITANLIYIDSLSKEPINLTINTDDYDTGYYFVLPKNINGMQVLKFYSEGENEEIKENNANSDNKENDANSENNTIIEVNTKQDAQQNIIEYQPGNKYYLSQQEIDESKIILNVVYNTKETKQNELSQVEEQNQSQQEQLIKPTYLYYKILETTIDQNKVKIEGYMPKDSDINIKLANYKEVENKIKNEDETLNLNIAYDIKILSNNQKYEPNKFDENVKVTISGIVDKENTAGLKVIHIDDEDKIEEIKSISIEEENLSFNTETFSIFAIVSPSVNYTQANTAWNGSIANKFSWGTGTQNDPYLIATGEELAYLRTQVNNGYTYSRTIF